MQKKASTICISSYEEMEDEIWKAVTDYTHELYGNEGQIQIVSDHDCDVYVVQSTAYNNKE